MLRLLPLLFLLLSPRVGAALPSEWVVFLAPAAAAQRAEFTARLAGLGLRPLARLDDGLAPTAAPAGHTGPARFGLDPTRVLLVAATDSAAATAALESLAADPAIEHVEPNASRAVATLAPDFPNDPMFRDGRQWALRNLGAAGPFGGTSGADIRALEAWSVRVGANDVRLAVADTGVDPLHPELAASSPGGLPRVLPGINVSGDPTGSTDDLYGHGMLVTGVMAARAHDGTHFDSLGIAGVCGGDGGANLGCRILPIKITRGHESVTGSFEIARAILAAAESGARAVNVSFVGGGPSGLERRALYHALVRGCVAVCASGNDGWHNGTAARYPAAYAADRLAIQVGASTCRDARAVWSSYGPGLDLVAPGEDVWTAWMSHPSWNGTTYPGYVLASGTSFAAPHATGAVGLLAAARPELRDAGVQVVLREAAHDIGASGVDAETGYGRLDLAAALGAVDPAFGLWSDEVAGEAFGATVIDTLVVGDFAPPPFSGWTGRALAERVEIRATVPLPDSFLHAATAGLPAPRIWPRVGGTTTARGDFRPPYLTAFAEVIERGPASFTLRGWVFRLLPVAGEPIELPIAVDLARFGFSVLGPVARPVAGAGDRGAPARALRVGPNPFRTAATIELPGPGRLTVFDVRGRAVRNVAVRGTIAAFTWDGRDDRGGRVPAGLYLLRHEGPHDVHLAKLVRLD
jgi:subtilisin family serine protease